MTKPKQLIIGPHIVPIKYLLTLDDATGMMVTDPNPMIYINAGLKGRSVYTTIFHEALHAIFYFHGMEFEKIQEEERIVRLLECEVTALLLHNKALARGLVT